MEEQLKEMSQDIKALHKKLDDFKTETTRNTTDIAWLKRGMFGSYFTAVAGVLYAKLFGG